MEKYLLNSAKDLEVSDYVQLYEEGDVIRLKDEPDMPRRVLRVTKRKDGAYQLWLVSPTGWVLNSDVMPKKYTLRCTPKGKKFLYEVKDEQGRLYAKRLSNRDNYVACTLHGEFFFGRIDLIGKGDHNKIVTQYMKVIEAPKAYYEKMRAWWIREKQEVMTYEDWKQTAFRGYAQVLYFLNTVVYR